MMALIPRECFYKSNWVEYHSFMIRDLKPNTETLLKQAFKAAMIDIRYFARGKFSRSLVHNKNLSLIW